MAPVIPELTEDIMRNLNIQVKYCQDIYGPPQAYKNDAGPPRGAIFIANYRKFGLRKLKTREGSEIDVRHLTKLYTQMGYKVVIGIEDKTKDETIEAMISFRDHSIHEEVNSMVLIVMSHGSNANTFFTYDGKPMTSLEVYDIFSDKNCPALIGKPKMFTFQHCRGTFARTKYQERATLSHDINTPQLRPVSRLDRQKRDKALSDIILLYSTFSGEVSLRGRTFGSPYIIQICRVFMEKAWQSKLENLMEEVQKGLDKYQGCEYKEIRKKKDIYLNPKAPSESNLETDTFDVDCHFQQSPVEHNASQQQVQSESNLETDTFDVDCHFQQSPVEQELTAHSRVPKLNPLSYKFVLLMNNLDGCQSDMEKLKEMFRSFDYKIIGPISNITYKILQEVLKDFKEKNHNDEAFIIFYGDGFNDYLVTSDQCAIHFEELQSEFSDINCPKLSGIPKIFITNLCYFEGNLKNEEADSQNLLSEWNSEKSNEGIHQKPTEAERDMFFLNVEVEGTHCENGSLLTKALWQVLMQNTSKKQLMKIMRSVSEKLDQLQEGDEGDYICELRTIKFPSDFSMSPNKAQRIFTPPQEYIPATTSRSMRRDRQPLASHTQPSGALRRSSRKNKSSPSYTSSDLRSPRRKRANVLIHRSPSRLELFEYP